MILAISEREIESLIYLLEDPDPEVRRQVEDRFLELGDRAVPLLDEQRVRTRSEGEKKRIESMLGRLTFDGLCSDYLDLLEQGIERREQLERLLFQLARIGNPTLNIREYRKKLDHIASELSGRVVAEPSERLRLRLFLQYLFRDLNFRGDQQRYHHPDNGLLDRVIDRRKGLPLMLGVIVLVLADRLGLPFEGINMPIHFMILYRGHSEQTLIDPFDGGRVVTYDQCFHFLKQNGIKPQPSHFEPASNSEILMRATRNLIHSYSMLEDELKVTRLRTLLQRTEKSLSH